MNRVCARPICSASAVATLSYDYETRRVWVHDLHEEPHPMTHDLCQSHADRSRPPSGWELCDDRPSRSVSPSIPTGLSRPAAT